MMLHISVSTHTVTLPIDLQDQSIVSTQHGKVHCSAIKHYDRGGRGVSIEQVHVVVWTITSGHGDWSKHPPLTTMTDPISTNTTLTYVMSLHWSPWQLKRYQYFWDPGSSPIMHRLISRPINSQLSVKRALYAWVCMLGCTAGLA